MKVKDDRTLVSKIHRSTDKVPLRDHPYSKTLSKRRVTKTAYKEINLRVGYSKHSQWDVSINLPKETNDSKQ